MVLEQRFARGSGWRVEITAFRRRTIVATGAGPVNEPRNNDDSEGSDVVQRVILEFEADDFGRTDDLMKLIEVVLEGQVPRWKKVSIDKQNNGGSL